MRSDQLELMAGDGLKKGLGTLTASGVPRGGIGSNGVGAGGRHQVALCVGCGGQIHDQYILRVAPNLEWHAACLKCSECQMFLDENCTCFVRDGKTFCKKDYVRLFGAKCDRCLLSFGKNDYVMRAKNRIFHLDCFRCVACKKQLVPGDEFALRHDELFCKDDSSQDGLTTTAAASAPPGGKVMKGEPGIGPGNMGPGALHENNNTILQHNTSNSSEDNSEAPCDLSDEDMSVIDSQEEAMMGVGGGKSSKSGGGGPGSVGSSSGAGAGKKGGDRKSARARTVLSEKQLNILKTCYSANPRPDALMKEQLVEMTALSPRVIRVWFQNKRCKDKKIQNRMLEKQMQRESDGRKLGYGSMHGIPMVATSPVRHESPVGLNPVEIQSYEPPWKALTDFALHTDLDRLNPNAPQFQHLVNQMHGYPDMPLPPPDMHHPGGPGGLPPHPHPHPPPPGSEMPPFGGPDGGMPPAGGPPPPPPPPPGSSEPYPPPSDLASAFLDAGGDRGDVTPPGLMPTSSGPGGEAVV